MRLTRRDDTQEWVYFTVYFMVPTLRDIDKRIIGIKWRFCL